ncbi:MAG: cytochrome c [Fimbriimonadaceae bacterium]|nr:cytochrome c [Chitinophagales bacterium]
MKQLLIFFICSIIIISCNKNEKEDIAEKKEKQKLSANSGKDIYIKNCKLCHGVDGKLGISSAADLSISVLTIDEKINVITNGRKGMAPWKGQLSPEQIKLVAEYVQTLHQ